MHQMLQWIAETWTVVATCVLNVKTEHWAAVAAFGSAIAAVVQVFVAVYQSKIQRRQERISLSDKRFFFYNEFSYNMSRIIYRPYEYKEIQFALRHVKIEFERLFGEDVFNKALPYIEDLFDISGEWVAVYQRKIKDFPQNIPMEARIPRKEQGEYHKKLNRVSVKLYKIIKPHLIISKKEF